MQSTEVQRFTAFDADWRDQLSRSTAHGVSDEELIEIAARALFEFVFSRTERLDPKQRWTACGEATRDGFRAEAKAVLEAIQRFKLCAGDKIAV